MPYELDDCCFLNSTRVRQQLPATGSEPAHSREDLALLWLLTTMRAQSCAVVVLLLAFAACSSAQQRTSFTIDHRVLILTTAGYPNADFIEVVLNGTGVPYNKLAVNTATNINATLYRTGGIPKYSAIVYYPNVDANGNLNLQQLNDLWGYRAQFGVRAVRFGAWMGNWGYVPLGAGTSGAQNLVWSAAMPFGISGIKNVQLPANNMYRVPATLASATPASRTCNLAPSLPTGFPVGCTMTTLATLTPNSALGAGYELATIAAAMANYTNGLQDMVFGLDMAAWIPNAMVIGHAVLPWLLRNVIPGMRRVLLSTQVDDVFLATEWCTNPNLAYRITPADVRAMYNFQTSLNAGLPAGSNYTVDLVFNGNGILEEVGIGNLIQDWDFSCSDDPLYTSLGCNCALTIQSACTSTIPFCRNCTKDWRRGGNWGINRILATYSPLGWPTASALRAGDTLTNAVTTNLTLLNGFIWTSHTFSHQNLHNSTLSDSQKQWDYNRQMANRIGLNVAAKYNPKGVVTPGISGLTNGNNYPALVNLGYTSAVGDNTWPFLLNNDRRWWALTSTVAVNEYAGYKIIPRWATEVYFCASDINDEVAQYNTLYRSFFGFDSNVNQIMDREADRVFASTIMGLKHDPHMFHQANLALKTNAAWTGSKSLLQVWVEKVTSRLTGLTTWPVETLKQDDLLNWYNDREQRDKCGLTYTLNVQANAITSIAISSTAQAGTLGTCKAPLLTASTANLIGTTAGPNTNSGAKHSIASLAVNAVTTIGTSPLAW